jgi:hypothetical protein
MLGVGGLHHPLRLFTRVIMQKVAISLIAGTRVVRARV